MSKQKAILCWSGGKDSSYCLHKVIQEGKYEIKYLLTTLNAEYKRISMHGVREELLDLQADAIGIPLIKVFVSEGTNAEYEKKTEEAFLKAKNEGIDNVIFGDIFLEDLREYREKQLSRLNMKAVFPLWKMDTKKLVRDFIDLGFRSITCCTNDGFLGKEWVGKEINGAFLSELPETVDPCGERGEYHSFCFEGPIFKKKISVVPGKKIYKALEIKTTDCDLPSEERTKGFWFCEIS
jgi:uncharacterized protein (TIGR00290 family)